MKRVLRVVGSCKALICIGNYQHESIVFVTEQHLDRNFFAVFIQDLELISICLLGCLRIDRIVESQLYSEIFNGCVFLAILRIRCYQLKIAIIREGKCRHQHDQDRCKYRYQTYSLHYYLSSSFSKELFECCAALFTEHASFYLYSVIEPFVCRYIAQRAAGARLWIISPYNEPFDP